MKTITLKLAELLRRRVRRQQGPTLGARELEVMKIFWQAQALSAKQVLQRLPDQTLSLSTMQSTLERLYRKELLLREKAGRFYVYRAAVSRSQVISQLLGDIAEQVGDGEMAPMISGFMTFVGMEHTELDPVSIPDADEKPPLKS